MGVLGVLEVVLEVGTALGGMTLRCPENGENGEKWGKWEKGENGEGGRVGSLGYCGNRHRRCSCRFPPRAPRCIRHPLLRPLLWLPWPYVV